MEEKKSFIQSRIEDIKAGKRADYSQKKKRISRIILVIDAVVIAIILVYFINKKDSIPDYYSSSLRNKQMQVRFSISTIENRNAYLFSLTIESNLKKEKYFIFDRSVASLTITHKDKEIAKKKIGENITKLKLIPGKTKTFVEKINSDVFQRLPYKGSTGTINKLFKFQSRIIPLKSLLVINMKDKFSTTIDFKHEVSK